MNTPTFRNLVIAYTATTPIATLASLKVSADLTAVTGALATKALVPIDPPALQGQMAFSGFSPEINQQAPFYP